MRSESEEKRWETLIGEARVGRPRPGFLDGLERRLREETEKRAAAVPSARGRVFRWGGLAAAAAVLLAVGLAFGPWAGDDPEPDIPYCPPATVVVAVHATPPVHAREQTLSLMELVEEADVILAGQFVKGGHENSFRVDRVLKGGDPGGVISLLTQNGLRCPGPAVPRAGAWAVVFAVREDDGLAVPSGSWLRQFRDVVEWEEFSERIALRRGPAAAEGIAEALRDARRARPDAPFDELKMLVRDLGVVGGVRGVVALMELQLEYAEEDVHGYLLDALAKIRLRSAEAPDLSAELERLREALEASQDDLSSDEKKRLLERIMKLSNVPVPDRFVPDRPEPIEDPGALRDRLAAVNAALRRSFEGEISADPDSLRAGAEAVRAALAREVALDDGRTAHQRGAALSIAIRQAPDALSGEEVAALVADERLPYFLRRLAVELSGRGRLGDAAPALFDLVVAEPPSDDGPEPRAGWFHGASSGGMVRLTAIDALAEIGSPRAVRLLRDLLTREDLDEAITRATRAALRRSGRKR